MALACHLGPWVGLPVIVAGLLYVTQKDKSAFVRFHAVQSAVFQAIAGMALAVIGGAVSIIVSLTCGLGFPLLFVVIAAALAAGCLDAYHGYLAYQGQWAAFPQMEDLEARLGLTTTQASPPPAHSESGHGPSEPGAGDPGAQA